MAYRADGIGSESEIVKQRTAERNARILRSLADGMTHQEIAESMFITVPTFKVHLTKLKKKLGARNSVHLVAIAMANGLIDPPEQRAA